MRIYMYYDKKLILVMRIYVRMVGNMFYDKNFNLCMVGKNIKYKLNCIII